MAATTTPAAPEGRPASSNRPPDPRDDLEGVVGILARSLQGQTDALVTEVRALGGRLDAGIADMRAEARSTRYWFVGAIVVVVLVLGGIVGVRTALDVPGVGTVTTSAPAGPP